jgi:metal-sulfur cluster biosynthetic enzyme
MNKEKKPNYPHWAIEDSHPDIVNDIRSALRAVKDPEIGMDLIQLGLIRNITISDNKAGIEMILTTPYCPYAPMLMESARKKVEEKIKIPTEIKYGKEVWNETMMEDQESLNWGLF